MDGNRRIDTGSIEWEVQTLVASNQSEFSR
jgi:hypothetical protein